VDAETIDISRPGAQYSRSRAARAYDYTRALLQTLRALQRAPRATVYLTVAQSGAGFLRDAAFVGLARALGRHRIVLHVHGGNYGGFHAAQPRLLRRAIRRLARASDALIVLSESLRGMFDFAPEVSDRIVVVANGLPAEPPSLGVPKRAPAEGEAWRVLFLSNLVESKGYLELIEGIAKLVGEGWRVELDLCGEFRSNPGEDRRVTSPAQAREFTEARIRSLGLEHRVRLRGTVQGAEKERLLAEAQVFALPTRYDAEGQPLSIIEAMAWGCPVIATRYRGIPDLVEDGVTGWLIDRPDPAAIADRIRALCAAPASYERMSAAGRARFEAHFTRSAHLAALRRVLRV
jgi:glycosyltransferase involved in cell wall biosynthesis